MILRRVVAFVLPPLALLAAVAAPRAAADEASATQHAIAAAAKVRAKLPTPLDPEDGKPALDFKFEGDLVQTGENSGSVVFRIDVGTFRDEPVWLVNDEKIDEFGGSRTVTESVVYLKPDLSVIKGEWRRTTAEASVRITFLREGDGFDVKREVTKGTAEPVVSTKRLVVPADATYGRGAMLLFLRYAPAAAGDYALNWLPLESMIPQIDEHEAPVELEPMRINVVGAAKLGDGKAAVDSWMARLRQGRRLSEVDHFDPKTRALLTIEWPGAKIVPKGKGGVKAVYEDDQPALTWKAAFLKFGHGYHLAVPKWVDAAIHWETMLALEVAAGEWPKDTVLADFKKAYIAEFMAKSKHRPRAQADSLLRGALMTAEQKTEKDGSVVIATSPDFGGSIYHFKAIDGVWYLFRIDQ